MRTISIIKREHRNLAAVLFSMEKLIEEIEEGKQADLTIFHGLFTYINRFLDRYHHPKESHYLFPKVLEKAPDTKALIEELGRQHKEGELLFIDMLKALSAFEFSGQDEFPEFRDAVVKYVAFEREHAIKEEREVLPRAQEVLDESDWEEIDEAFSKNEDPMFGEQWSSQFSDLFRKIVNELPEPLGLGSAWK